MAVLWEFSAPGLILLLTLVFAGGTVVGYFIAGADWRRSEGAAMVYAGVMCLILAMSVSIMLLVVGLK